MDFGTIGNWWSWFRDCIRRFGSSCWTRTRTHIKANDDHNPNADDPQDFQGIVEDGPAANGLAIRVRTEMEKINQRLQYTAVPIEEVCL